MTDTPWWKTGIVYQIYPRSYQDSNGDGIGDLRGIQSRLDHVASLGVDAIWISPMFPSPMADFGYDVSDYSGVGEMFGTMEDFDALSEAIHARGMKLILDFVPGHSSDRHPWFLESRASRESPKRDWYVWRDPAPDGGPPTNWIAHFGGSAWEKDEATGQYYLHMFLKEQPNLNWRNPDLLNAMMDAMRFWYDRGVDGFRVDAFENVGADPDLGDNPPNPDWMPGKPETWQFLQHATLHRPEVFDVAREMRRVAEEYDPPRVLIGEIYAPYPTLMRYYGDALDAFQLPFNFMLLDTEWDADRVADVIREYESHLPEGGAPNWVLGNHDRPRFPTRYGYENARAALMLLLTLRGTPTLYQGDELGMENVPVPADRIVDPWGHTMPEFGRDPMRTPMPWDDSATVGFTTGEPWLPVGLPQGGSVSVQDGDPSSTLSLTRSLIDLRRRSDALTRGEVGGVASEDGVLRYERVGSDRRLGVAINFTDEPRPFPFDGETLLSTSPSPGDTLAPHEGRIVRL